MWFLENQYGMTSGFLVVFRGFSEVHSVKPEIEPMPEPLQVSPQGVQSRLAEGARLLFLDVREPEEFSITHLDNSQLVPMAAVPAELQRIEALADDADLVILCHHGVRSLQVAAWLRQQGIENCFSLTGGIDAWSREIDPAVPRY